jgi:DNA-binding NtrC family response regulator
MNDQPLRVVLIDDDEDYFVIVRDLLAEAEGFRVELKWLDSFEKGLAAIGQNHTDVFIVDYRLGALNIAEVAESMGVDFRSLPRMRSPAHCRHRRVSRATTFDEQARSSIGAIIAAK